MGMSPLSEARCSFRNPRRSPRSSSSSERNLKRIVSDSGRSPSRAGFVAQAGDPAEGETALRSHEVQVHRVALLGLDRGPGLPLLGNEQWDQHLVVPENCARGATSTSIWQSLQDFRVPFGLLADRKTLAGKVPFLSQDFPGHQVLGILPHAGGERAEPLHGPIQEFPKLGRSISE